MKIASFNVENLFDRAKAFNEEDSVATGYISRVAELNSLFIKEDYSDADKYRMKTLLIELGLERTDSSTFAILRKIRGKIVYRPRNSGEISIVANGKNDWLGWAELKTAHVDEIALQNTGRVFKEVNADIQVVVEAENRLTLKQFNEMIISEVGGTLYDKVMVIDGNDDRGIDVGMMTRHGYTIELMKSHIFDRNEEGNLIFSRDLPEYKVTTPAGEIIWVLPVHFKSKFGGNDPRSQRKREGEARKAAEVYRNLRNSRFENVVILGDFNDTPNSEQLRPLLEDTDLLDFSEHPTFVITDKGGKGTFGNGADNNKIDYILLSPELFARVTSCGIFRKGAWPGKVHPKWDVFEELKKEIHSASDHHLVWCEIT